MTRVSHLMRDYFDECSASNKKNSLLMFENANVPIVPEVITWKVVTDPERFMRRFEFSSRERLTDFLGEVLELENEIEHNGKITIDHLNVDIEIYTKSIDCITELDVEYTKAVSQIYEDVMQYGYTNNE